jgi:hypothetical protein
MMHANKIDVLWVTPEGVAVDLRGRAVGGPAGVSDGDLGEESLLLVDGRVCNLLAETGHFADLLEEDHITGAVAIDADACRGGGGPGEQEQERGSNGEAGGLRRLTGRVVTSVLLARKALA